MLFSCSTLLLAALSLVSALSQPAHHRHSHKNRRAVGDVVTATIDGKVVSWANTYDGGAGKAAKEAAPAAPQAQAASNPPVTTEPEPKPKGEASSAAPASKSPDKSSDKSSSASSSPQASSGRFGGVSAPKDNGNKDQYIGNVGIPYGSNMIKLNSVEEAKNFKYSNTFNNPTSEKITVVMWNKSGKDGQAQSGMGLEPNMQFDLQPNESVAVAFDENSQVAFSQKCEKSKVSGLRNCTWGEIDFGDLRNGGWSGYDRSSIPNSEGNTGLLTISCKGAETSSKEDNSFVSAAQSHAGGALAPGPAHFYTTMGVEA